MLFVGLLYLSSRLKKDTRGTVDSLIAADIAVNMITGDHIHTAIAVAQDAGILLPFSPQTNRLYIVDEAGREGFDGATIIIDSSTDTVLETLTLETLLERAALCQSALFSCALDNIQRPSAPLVANDNVQIACTGRGLSSVLRNFPPLDAADPSPTPNPNPNRNLLIPPESAYRSLLRYARVFARTKPKDKKVRGGVRVGVRGRACRG